MEEEKDSKKMRSVLDCWKNVDSDRKTVASTERTVGSVVVVDDVKMTRKKNTEEKSAVQQAREKFSMLSKEKENSFELWKARKKNEGTDRSANAFKNSNLFTHSMGEGRGGAVGEGEQGAARDNFIHPCRGGNTALGYNGAASSDYFWQPCDRREGKLCKHSGCQGKTGS